MMMLMITIEVKLLGALQKLAGKDTVSLEFDSFVVVKDVIFELANSLPSKFKKSLIDPEINDPRTNVLVLLNKKEISVLDGLGTKVENGDKLILIPISHGG